ncbi:hypothetical protein DFH08DRAFT_801634 [Mycena albidolilacea]|uniref:Uncharacterized protein n=1 Tax=Mycena albidolilacea TaxID=1033008 RepID=A0AAD7AJZ3_9AGAR|nr:hypothetical protein DFH08DRAFT_801634 [Mycena albidolilacea]
MSMLYYLTPATTWKEFKDNWAWDRPRKHLFASGTKWLAHAILPDAIKTGVGTACDEKSTTLSDAIKRAWAWLTQTKYALKTLLALSKLSHCIDAPAPADLFIHLMVRLNSQLPGIADTMVKMGEADSEQ